MLEISSLAKKYQAMARAHDRGAEDGNNNFPLFDDDKDTQTESEIVQLAQADFNRSVEAQKEENDSILEKINTLKNQISSEFLYDIETFKTRAELKIGEVERNLTRLYSNVLARQQEYRYFKTRNKLNRDADIRASHYVALAWLLFVIVIDGVINAYFFKDSNANALLGGFILAFIISLANTMFGFLAGLAPWRYLQHRNRLHCIWAFPSLIFLMTLIFVFNLAVGHYREILLSDKDAPADQALASTISAPLGLHSIYTFVLVAAGIGVAMFAAYKGYTFTDSYPRYGRYFKRRIDAEEEFESSLKALQSEIYSIANSYINEAKSIIQNAARVAQEITTLSNEATSRSDKYTTERSGIEDACNAALRTYRDANIQVRDVARFPPPIRFSKRVTFASNLNEFNAELFSHTSNEIKDVADKLKQKYEILAQQIPKEARRLLSEDALNRRVESLKRNARRLQKEEENSV